MMTPDRRASDGSLHEISAAIGELRAGHEELLRGQAAGAEQRVEQTRVLYEISTRLAAVERLKNEVATMKPHVDRMKLLSNKSILVFLMVAAVAGAAGHKVLEFLAALRGA